MSLRSIEINKFGDDVTTVHSEKTSRRSFLYVPKDEFSILCIYNDELVKAEDLEKALMAVYNIT